MRDVSTVDVAVQLLYVAVCLLPLGWVVGCLPPLDSLLPWAMEQLLTRLMGGSPMSTDLRYIIDIYTHSLSLSIFLYFTCLASGLA